MRKALAVAGLALWHLGASCNPQPPKPDPCQGVSCPTGQHCEGGQCVDDPVQCPDLGVPWCHELTPPATCGACQHQPPDQRCPVLAPKCPEPEPSPKCDRAAGQNCNCYVFLDVSQDWRMMSCEAPKECVNHVCTSPTEPPTGDACPKPLAPGARVYMRGKSYGNGFDSTVRVYGDPGLCFAIHGEMINDCHLDGWKGPKGDDPTARARCEMQLLGGCPIWFFSADGGKTVQRCHDDQAALASCDHFGSAQAGRDDPKTPEFEGWPPECGLQRDEFGPNAGFFVIAHGKALVRACRPDAQECSPWMPFNKSLPLGR